MAQRISARRARIQEEKARKRVFWALVFTAVMGLLFLFFVVPLVFRVVVSISRSDNQVFAPQDTIPPQAPAYQPLDSFIADTQITITGYTEPEAKVYLIVNNKEGGETTADSDGQFTFTPTWEEGEYEYYFYAEDAAKNSSVDSSKEIVVVDTTEPTVVVESPEDGQTFTLRREKTLEVRGQMSEEGTVLVKGSRVSTDEEGSFSTRIQLGEGTNEIKVRAEDPAGNTSEEQVIIVEYQPY